MKPVVFVPGLPGSELFDSATGERLFLNLGGLISKTARPRFLARLEGPQNPNQDDGVVAGEPIADVLDLDLFDLGKQAQTLSGGRRRRRTSWPRSLAALPTRITPTRRSTVTTRSISGRRSGSGSWRWTARGIHFRTPGRGSSI